MIGGILAVHRFSGAVTQTVWVVPGPNLRFNVDIKVARYSEVGGGGDSGLTDLIFGKIGEAPRFTARLTTNVNRTITIPSMILSTGDSVLATFHQEIIDGVFNVTRSVNIWVIGREIFKSDFFETR